MDSQLADAYLSDWGIWSNSDIRQGLCATQAWQREMESGYAEEPEAGRQSISTPDDVLQRVDAAVSRVNLRWPAMGNVLRQRYLKQRHAIDPDMLNSALLRFVGVWDGHLD